MRRVFIIARSPAARAGLRARCVAAGLIVVGEGAAWSDAPPLGTTVILGTDEFGGGELDITGDPTRPPVLLLSDEPSALRRAASVGADGWGVVHSTAGPDELSAAVDAVAQGLAVAPTSFMLEVIPALDAATGVDFAAGAETGVALEALTPREREVLELVGEGRSNRSIADALGISEHTVKFHLASIYGKLGVSTRTGAVRRGLRRGLITI